ncbi:MAG TPA: twin-arginine translocation signal domain-containing protein, partial [Opitutaceae bacterium]|nr:twin-arginine translocation signal domain-containing protein [Opitutaceae bacterium]
MNRRQFLKNVGGATALAALSLPTLAWADEKSKLKITGIRLAKTRPKKPYPDFTPAAGSWSTQNVEVSAPLNIYPEYKPTRSLFAPVPPWVTD